MCDWNDFVSEYPEHLAEEWEREKWLSIEYAEAKWLRENYLTAVIKRE